MTDDDPMFSLSNSVAISSMANEVNGSSIRARTTWLIFVALNLYIIAMASSVSHSALLLEAHVSIGQLQLDLPILPFFTYLPLVVLLAHFIILDQHIDLFRKIDFFGRLVGSDLHRQEKLLHSYFITSLQLGDNRPSPYRFVHYFLFLFSFVLLPIITLMTVLVKFLPYQSWSLTLLHKGVLTTSCILIYIFLLSFRRNGGFRRNDFRGRSRGFKTIISAYLCASTSLFFSWCVATIPDDPIDLALGYLPQPLSVDLDPDRRAFFLTALLFEEQTSSLRSATSRIFSRTLVVVDADLVSDREVTQGESTIRLRGRNLRYARLDRSDMHQADLTGADLTGASLEGTDLRNATLQCSDIEVLRSKSERRSANCVIAIGANFSGAELSGALMTGIDARGASFEKAILEDADIVDALISGANFRHARLDKANLTGPIVGYGADFTTASLQGANLKGARLLGADFRWASMQAAIFDHARLEGATLEGADLEAASLYKSRLEASDLNGAKLNAVDLRNARIWLSKPPAINAVKLLDTTNAVVEPLDADGLGHITKEIEEIKNPALKYRVTDQLAKLFDRNSMGKWQGTAERQSWESILRITDGNISARPHPVQVDNEPTGLLGADAKQAPPPRSANSLYSQQLTEHLKMMICRVRWLNGAVATGVALRAIQPQFRGDLTAIDEQLSEEECSAAKGVPARVARELQWIADLTRN